MGSSAAVLAGNILARMTAAVGFADRGVFARPTLYVLRKTRMPAVLLEIGFITNAGEAYLMATEPYRIANGIANGIFDHLGWA